MTQRFEKDYRLDGWPIVDNQTGFAYFTADKDRLVDLLNFQDKSMRLLTVECVELQKRGDSLHKALTELAQSLFENGDEPPHIEKLLNETTPQILDLSDASSHDQTPNEYGLDTDYFYRAIKRDLSDLSRYKPGELARVLMRLAKAADETVINETEFSRNSASFSAQGPQRITLTLEEIRSLAEAAGFEVVNTIYEDEEELKQEMTVSTGVRIKDEETGVLGELTIAAWFTDLPDEGVMEIRG